MTIFEPYCDLLRRKCVVDSENFSGICGIFGWHVIYSDFSSSSILLNDDFLSDFRLPLEKPQGLTHVPTAVPRVIFALIV